MEDLLPQLKARDANAQQQLRRDMFPRIQATCTRLLRDPVRAEEIAEDIWMDFLFTHVDKVREPRAVPSYLRMMTVRRCVRLREFDAKHQEVKPGTEPSANPETDLVAQLDKPRELARLEHCLKKLNERARWMLKQRFFEDQKLDQIGDQAGVSKQYAGRVLKQSLARLRKCVGSLR